MTRLITVHPKRQTIPLDGFWGFVREAQLRRQPPPDTAFTGQLPVPGVWESSLSHFNYRGVGWYRRDFVLPGAVPSDLRLAFGAVTHTADVFFDGRRIGGHQVPHTAFDFVLPSVRPGTHTLVVRVDNAHGPDKPLYRAGQDIFLFGGIPQPVTLEILPSVAIRSASALPRKVGARWVLDVKVAVNGKSPPVTATLDGRPIGSVQLRRNGTGAATFDVGRVGLWSPESPRLYTVRLEAGPDAWQERIGFRTVVVRGKNILLNGKPLWIKGVNRHEHHPDFGSALPPTVHARDIEILQRMGANFVRGSHYPNDPLFLDLCDEHGLLFWEELSHWQASEADLGSPLFLQRSLEQLDEMVTQHAHHPSIILWGMLNESDTHVPVARKVVGALARRFRQLDPTRPVTFASNRPERDCCLDLVDVVSCNTYPGWYDGTLEEAPGKLAKTIRLLAKRADGKPVILSEFGAAAITGCRSFENRKWTENYQADLLARLLATIRDSGRVCGVAIWQYCDVRTCHNAWYARPREYNNKGLLSDYREPKQAFYAVQRAFSHE